VVRVLLVNPFQVDLVARKGRIYNRVWTPLDLANCAAILEREGIDVSIIDANAERLGPSEVAGRAKGYDKVFVTSTTLDRWQCPQLDINPFLNTIRALNDVVPEVYGMGSHGTVKPVELLSETGARAIIRGEPERTVLDLCNTNSLSQVRGITFDGGKQVLSTPDQKPVDLNGLPLPAFHLLPMSRYHYEVMGDHFTLFEMSRGCASRCTFCLLKTYGAGVRRKHVDKLIQEVEYAIQSFGVQTAYFFDLEFTLLRNQVVEFCQYMIKKQHNFTWCCQTRLDLVDDELLDLMRRAGCRLIHCGVEASDNQTLQIVKKGITTEAIEEGMRKIKAAGIDTACFFMMGLPEATQQDMDDIVRFAKKLNPTYALFHLAAPYPGTKLYERVENDPDLRFSDDSLFPEAVEGRFTLPELKAVVRKAHMSYYLRPSYLFTRLQKGDLQSLVRQVRLFWAYVNGQ
jgi:anaerobic magnesium-protoporphyrin IX monomethyl ester cyclase